MINLTPEQQALIDEERLWLPHCRVIHAQYQLKKCDKKDRKVWNEILKMNHPVANDFLREKGLLTQ